MSCKTAPPEERSKTSRRTDDLYLKLSPIKSEEQELTQYKQFLRRNYATTVYDFLGVMHLQVIFYERSNYVVVYRGKDRKDGTFLEF
ncbi:hypothetical protein AAVH_30496 [Aphelenchoides avenae]|nr:hypothetical protein AAVH_30496 [Aphelenchus avenae]